MTAFLTPGGPFLSAGAQQTPSETTGMSLHSVCDQEPRHSSAGRPAQGPRCSCGVSGLSCAAHSCTVSLLQVRAARGCQLVAVQTCCWRPTRVAASGKEHPSPCHVLVVWTQLQDAQSHGYQSWDPWAPSLGLPPTDSKAHVSQNMATNVFSMKII